jgi:hypothetical protein
LLCAAAGETAFPLHELPLNAILACAPSESVELTDAVVLDTATICPATICAVNSGVAETVVAEDTVLFVAAVPPSVPEADLATGFLSFSRANEAVSRFVPAQAAFVCVPPTAELCVPSTWFAAAGIDAVVSIGADSASTGADSASTEALAALTSEELAAFVVEEVAATTVETVLASAAASSDPSPDSAACAANFNDAVVPSVATVELAFVAAFAGSIAASMPAAFFAAAFEADAFIAAFRSAFTGFALLATLFAVAVNALSTTAVLCAASPTSVAGFTVAANAELTSSCAVVPDATGPAVLLPAIAFAFCVRVLSSRCHARLKLSAVEDELAAPLTFSGAAADNISTSPMCAACIWPCLSTQGAKHFSSQSFYSEIVSDKEWLIIHPGNIAVDELRASPELL